jgi:hypothetical protein
VRSTMRRAFTLFDALVLVAATAAGLAGLRYALGDLTDVRGELEESLAALTAPDAGRSWFWRIFAGYGLTMTVLVPFCWSWTLALLGLRLRKPRLSRRQLGSQPGSVACFAAGITLVPALVFLTGIEMLSWLLFDIKYDSPVWEKGLGFFFVLLPAVTGIAVGGGWMTLLVGRRCRSEPTWIDRAGRGLGVYWISAIPLPVWALS